MTGREFLVLAERLAATDGIAESRSAISRAYYGAFHTAVGFALPRPESFCRPARKPTKKLRFCLLQSGVPTGKEAGEKIEIPARERNQADYELRQTRSERPSFAKRQVAVAMEIAACSEPVRYRASGLERFPT